LALQHIGKRKKKKRERKKERKRLKENSTSAIADSYPNVSVLFVDGKRKKEKERI